jgi:hypothetical protein
MRQGSSVESEPANGTVTWPGDIDIAPETLIWDGPYPDDEASRRPEPFLRPQPPRY